MPILVEDSTETVPSEYLEAFDPVRSKGLESGSQGCCGGEGSMGAVLVVVLLVRLQRVPEVGLVPDQRAVEELAAQRLDPAFHDRVRAGHPDASQDRRDPGAAEDLVDQCGVLAVTITDEEPDSCEAPYGLRAVVSTPSAPRRSKDGRYQCRSLSRAKQHQIPFSAELRSAADKPPVPRGPSGAAASMCAAIPV
jgi:hypothetical protein